MIISDQKKIVFIHIPKCGGTYVRHKLVHLDDRQGAYTSRLERHPDLGLLNFVHMPLKTLRDHFPAEYECVTSYFSFAILRDPRDRFASSVAQYCNRYSATLFKHHTRVTLQRQVSELIGQLTQLDNLCPGDRLPAELIHFQRQSDYTHIDGEQVLSRLVFLKDVDEFLAALLGSEDLRDVDRTQSNETKIYRNQAIKALASIGGKLAPGVAQRLPASMSSWIHKSLYRGVNNHFDSVFSNADVAAFIAEYYALDDLLLKKQLETV